MKKNGFVSMSLIYAFFIVFIAIMLSLLANYANNRILSNRVNKDIMTNIDNQNASLCSYEKGDIILDKTAYEDEELNAANGEIFDLGILIGRLKLTCSGYYKIEINGSNGNNVGTKIGGISGQASAIIYLNATSIIHYRVGHDSELKYYYNYVYRQPVIVYGGSDATDSMNGEKGKTIFDEGSESKADNIYEQYSSFASEEYGRLKITYFGNKL